MKQDVCNTFYLESSEILKNRAAEYLTLLELAPCACHFLPTNLVSLPPHSTHGVRRSISR